MRARKMQPFINFTRLQCAYPLCNFQLRLFGGILESLEKVQRRNALLEGLLARIERPRLEYVEVDGKKYQLPLLAKDAEIEQCSDDDLAYLSGFFDGDGCVTMCKKQGCFRLAVGQSVRGVDVLLRFRRAFGGGISRLSNGSGFKRPSVLWSVYGTAKVQRAAMLLARSSFTKHAQLCLAVNGPVAKQHRQQVGDELKDLKAAPRNPENYIVTWSYFSGFFDAEGCIGVRAGSQSLRLQLAQKQSAILQTLLSFLMANGFDSWRINPCGCKEFSLDCSMSNVSRQVLGKLLANGLSLKSEQAQIALKLEVSNRDEIRDALCELVGQQGRYRRLDSDGMRRAEEIHRHHKSIQRCREKGRLELLRDELLELQQEHRLRHLQHKNRLMRSDIRKLLNDGSTLRPLERQAMHKMRMLDRC